MGKILSVLYSTKCAMCIYMKSEMIQVLFKIIDCVKVLWCV